MYKTLVISTTPQPNRWSLEGASPWACDFGALAEPLYNFNIPGFVNSSLYTGDIDFVDIPAGAESYWILPVTCSYHNSVFIYTKSLIFDYQPAVSVQGNVITLPTGSSSFSAIDTGTTLVGGPSQAIAEIYAQIPDSAPGTGNFEGYYTYR